MEFLPELWGKDGEEMTLSEFAKALAEALESEGVTYEDLVRIQEEVKAEVKEELKGADNESLLQ